VEIRLRRSGQLSDHAVSGLRDWEAFGDVVRRKSLVVAVLLVASFGLSGCLDDKDQASCNNIAGNGKYSPVHDGGHVYCEDSWNGDRFLLRDE